MKKKIALIISSKELKTWSGGYSYYINLIKIISQIKKLNLTIYTDSLSYIYKMGINSKVTVKQLLCLKENSFLYFLRKIINLVLFKDIYLYCIMRLDRIDILSHRRLFKNKKIRVIGWIPDLQNKVLKVFFDKSSLKKRESYIREEIKKSNKIFVSSFQVKKEFKKYYGLNKSIIPLRIPSSYVESKKNKTKNYIFFPSQFWKHKNHQYIINTAKILKQRKVNIKFIFCGKIDDYRNKNNFDLVNKDIKKFKLDKYILNLGEVNNDKLQKLQNNCMAFINPSYYEGWSTINEEARSKNKIIFLSKIPGHLEQNNHGSIYFKINEPKSLAKKIIKFLKKKNKFKNLKDCKKDLKFKKDITLEAISILDKNYF
jgi:glycosyltransferase involved in cell wall biosynthesis